VTVLRAALKKHTAKEWEAIFGDEVPNGAVRGLGEIFDSPQVLGQGYVARMHHPEVGAYRGFAKPFHFGATANPETFAAPALGQHNEAILSELGYDADEIAALKRSGAVP
jgi:crotonobetainyl-CoA:carnitine CoA-transferase CaiB-like acyl-CoA transferase